MLRYIAIKLSPGRVGLLQLATLDWAGSDLQAHVGSAVRSLSFERSRFLFSGGCLSECASRDTLPRVSI